MVLPLLAPIVVAATAAATAVATKILSDSDSEYLDYSDYSDPDNTMTPIPRRPTPNTDNHGAEANPYDDRYIP